MHEGHRERMRQRILNDGLDSLCPHEILEYLLYSYIPRKDTNELAHLLLEKYGSLSNLFSAEPNDIADVPNMTQNAALFLTTLPALFKVYKGELNRGKKKIETRRDIVEYLSSVFMGDKTENFYMLCLDAQNNIIKLEKINSGSPSEVSVDPRRVVELALKNKATSVILAHNHPSGEVSPSHEDVELTKAIAVALELVKVKLYDHFIFSDYGYFFFSENGLVNIINNNVNRFLKEGLYY